MIPEQSQTISPRSRMFQVEDLLKEDANGVASQANQLRSSMDTLILRHQLLPNFFCQVPPLPTMLDPPRMPGFDGFGLKQ
jgi:hypothetical protein